MGDYKIALNLISELRPFLTCLEDPSLQEELADVIMNAFHEILNEYEDDKVPDAVISQLDEYVQEMGVKFAKYMEDLMPYISTGLKFHSEHETSSAIIDFITSIFSNLKEKVLPYCDELITSLLEKWDSPVHREIKLDIVLVFKEMVMAIGSALPKYLDDLLKILPQAAQIQFGDDSHNLRELQSRIIIVYDVIAENLIKFHPLPGYQNKTSKKIKEHVPFIINYIVTAGQDKGHNDWTIGSIATLIANLFFFYGAPMAPMLDNETVQNLLQKASDENFRFNESIKHARWVMHELKKLKENSQN